jgi:hypothetical protein
VRRFIAPSAAVLATVAWLACARAPEPAAPSAALAAPPSTSQKLGPGSLYNACERIWCLTHGQNFDLDHFLTGHVGFILHDDGSGDVFVPKHRTEGPEFPHARTNVLALCGKHVHPYWLGAGGGPVRKTGFNAALGYDRAHFASYGTRLLPCCVNAEAWAFLHAAAPREFRFGDRTTIEEMAGSGWQKAIEAQGSGGSDRAAAPRPSD